MTFIEISLITSIIAFTFGVVNAARKKEWLGIIVFFLGDLLSIAAVYFDHYQDFSCTTKILQISPVEYRMNAYNEGMYYGDWKLGYPHGYGKLVYNRFEDDQSYTIIYEDRVYHAEYYEGAFERGRRKGEGRVVYRQLVEENGKYFDDDGDYFIDEGEFFGKWEDGKTVFIGKRWYVTDIMSGYWNIEVIATGPISAETEYSEWVPVER